MPLSRKVIERHIEKFSTTTVIRVFSFMATSSYLLERFFWFVVLLGFSAATIWSVTQTVTTFIAEPTASLVSYVSNATTGLSFPDASLCLQVRAEELIALYEGHSEEVVANIHNFSSDFMHRLRAKLEAVEELENRRADTLMATLENVTDKKVAKSQLDAYHLFENQIFQAFSPGEVEFLAFTTAILLRLVDLETDPQPVYANWQSPLVEKLQHALVDRGVDYRQLFDLFAETFCVLHQIRVVATRSDPNSLLNSYAVYRFCTRATTVSFFGFSTGRLELICYKFRPREGFPPPLSFQTSFDYVTLTMHHESLYRHAISPLQTTKMYVDFAGTYELDEQIPLTLHFGVKQSAEFGVDAVNTLTNLRRRPCLRKNARKGSRMQCILWCRVELVALSCDCAPVSERLVTNFAKIPEKSQSCGNAEFAGERCRAALQTNYFDTANCSQSCLLNCESSLFSSAIREGDPSLDRINASTVMKLMPKKFIYERVDEYVTMDFKVFITSLGGNLSLYLGASFLAVIHIVVFFVKLPFEVVYQPEAKTQADTGNSGKPSDPKTSQNTQRHRQKGVTNAGVLQNCIDERGLDDHSNEAQAAVPRVTKF